VPSPSPSPFSPLPSSHETPFADDALSHAEIQAMREACKTLQVRRLDGCELYVTLEPCVMCYGAAVLHRLRRVVFACRSPKFGAQSTGVVSAMAQSAYNHKVEVMQIESGREEAEQLLKGYFRRKRSASTNVEGEGEGEGAGAGEGQRHDT
jgi:tRNA(adenine34) deaminase